MKKRTPKQIRKIQRDDRFECILCERKISHRDEGERALVTVGGIVGIVVCKPCYEATSRLVVNRLVGDEVLRVHGPFV
jgi:transcription elongation factor Elf1